MKLAEFLNDDTCQIFLAIIVGIIVCYFIFGSCGTCKDGFSVGGQACIKLPGQRLPRGSPQACYGLSEELCGRGPTMNICEWNQDVETPEDKCADYVMRIGSSLNQYSECQAGEDTDATNSLCCFGEEGLPAGSLLVDDRLPGYRACLHSSVRGTPLKTQFDQIVQFKEDCDNNLESGIVQIPGTDAAANSSPPPPADPIQIHNIRRQNIINNIITEIQKVEPDFTLDANSLTNNTGFNELNNILYFSRIIQQLKMEGNNRGLKFMILMNRITDPYEPDIYGREKKRISYDPYKLPSLNIPGKNIRLGDIFSTFRLLSLDEQKELYCTLNSREGPNDDLIYDPLLKMKNQDIINLGNNICNGQPRWEDCETNNRCDYLINNDPNTSSLKNTSFPDYNFNSLYLDNLYDMNATNVNLPSSSQEIILDDNFTNITTKSVDDKIQIKPSQNFTTTFPPFTRSVVSLDEFEANKVYSLESMYGMGNTGDYKIPNSSYYKNLLYVQYFIARVIAGTDVFFPIAQNPYKGKPPNPGEDMDISIPIGNRTISDAFDTTNVNSKNNIKCEESGIDYLLLVFREELPLCTSNGPSPCQVHDCRTDLQSVGRGDWSQGTYSQWFHQCGDPNPRCEYDYSTRDDEKWSAYLRQCESGENYLRPIGFCDKFPTADYCP